MNQRLGIILCAMLLVSDFTVLARILALSIVLDIVIDMLKEEK